MTGPYSRHTPSCFKVEWKGSLSIFPRLFNKSILKQPEPVVQRCSVKKVFLEISRNSQRNTCASVSFLIKLKLWLSCFSVKFLRTPLVAASEQQHSENAVKSAKIDVSGFLKVQNVFRHQPWLGQS